MPFEFFDHTGDIGVRLSGRTPDDLFASAAHAFTDTVTESSRVKASDALAFDLEATGLDLLLVDFLNEILYHFDTRQFLVAAADVRVTPGAAQDAACRLHAEIRGEVLDASRHPVKGLVKAITYHALEVVNEKGAWRATVIFDI